MKSLSRFPARGNTTVSRVGQNQFDDLVLRQLTSLDDALVTRPGKSIDTKREENENENGRGKGKISTEIFPKLKFSSHESGERAGED
jgi:hypothetical protein